MSKYLKLLDALDELRNSHNKLADLGHDPCGYAERRLNGEIVEAEEAVDAIFEELVGKALTRSQGWGVRQAKQ